MVWGDDGSMPQFCSRNGEEERTWFTEPPNEAFEGFSIRAYEPCEAGLPTVAIACVCQIGPKLSAVMSAPHVDVDFSSYSVDGAHQHRSSPCKVMWWWLIVFFLEHYA
jgi:hypothetical protein